MTLITLDCIRFKRKYFVIFAEIAKYSTIFVLKLPKFTQKSINFASFLSNLFRKIILEKKITLLLNKHQIKVNYVCNETKNYTEH